MTPIKFPKPLTAKAWRDNKGLFTKMVSDASGVGKALDKLEEKWKLVPWAAVDPELATANLSVHDDFVSTYTVANVKALQQTGDKSASKVDAVTSQLRAIVKLAGQTKTKWQKNKLVPPSSIKYLDQVVTAATTLTTQLGQLDAGWKSVQSGAEMSEKLIGSQLNSKIDTRLNLLRPAAGTVLEKPARQALIDMYDHSRALIPLLGFSTLKAHVELAKVLVKVTSGTGHHRNVTDDEIQAGIGTKDARLVLKALDGL